ncbi:MAG: ArsR/SmtB family transcription factor [Bacillota bacterium]
MRYIVVMKVINVLAEPNRMLIVELLRQGPLSVGEIAEQLGLNQPQVSKHLKVLSDAGIVEVQPITNRRIYKLLPEPFQELNTWVKSYLKIWDERFDNLDDYLLKMQGKDSISEDKKND